MERVRRVGIDQAGGPSYERGLRCRDRSSDVAAVERVRWVGIDRPEARRTNEACDVEMDHRTSPRWRGSGGSGSTGRRPSYERGRRCRDGSSDATAVERVRWVGIDRPEARAYERGLRCRDRSSHATAVERVRWAGIDRPEAHRTNEAGGVEMDHRTPPRGRTFRGSGSTGRRPIVRTRPAM